MSISNANLDVESEIVNRKALAQVDLAQMSAKRALTMAQSKATLDRTGLVAGQDSATKSLQRRHARERLVLSSDFALLKARVAPVRRRRDRRWSGRRSSTTINPATDPGSLSTVAKTIGDR